MGPARPITRKRHILGLLKRLSSLFKKLIHLTVVSVFFCCLDGFFEQVVAKNESWICLVHLSRALLIALCLACQHVFVLLNPLDPFLIVLSLNRIKVSVNPISLAPRHIDMPLYFIGVVAEQGEQLRLLRKNCHQFGVVLI